MKEEKDFSAYSNSLVKTTRLEKLENKYVNLVLNNGFTYQGILMVVYDDAVILMDRKIGRQRFPRNRIFVVYETPIGAKHKNE